MGGFARSAHLSRCEVEHLLEHFVKDQAVLVVEGGEALRVSQTA